MASPRPTASTPSLVLRLDADAIDRDAEHAGETRPDARRCAARASAARARRSRRRSPPRTPRRATIAHARASRSSPGASFHCGSVLGKCRPMSPGPAAPSIASISAWHSDVAVRMAERAAIGRQCHAGQHQRPALDEPVKVVSGADARTPAQTRTGRRQIVSGRDLHVACVSRHDDHRVSRPFGQHRLVGRLDAALAERDRRREHVASKSLRRLRQPDLLARQRPGHRRGDPDRRA